MPRFRSTKSTQAIGENFLFANAFHKEHQMSLRTKRFLQSLFTIFGIASFCFAGTSVASASYTQVGPTLTPSTAKADTQTMLTSDTQVMKFLHLSQSAAVNIKVITAKRFKCHVAVNKKQCPFNTAKDGTKIIQIDFRHGQWRWAYRVKFRYHGMTKFVTFHEHSSNLLSGATTQSHPHHGRDTAKDIQMSLVVKVSASASATSCGVTAKASAGAMLKTLTIKVSSKASKGWSQISSAISAAASATATVTGCATGSAPAPGCTTNSATSPTNSGTACQSNAASSDQTAKVTPTCTGTVSNSCNTYIYQYTVITQVNVNCAYVVFGDGSNGYVENGSIVNICSSQDTNVCTGSSNCNEQPPPPQCDCQPPLNCPPGNTPSSDNTHCVKDGSTTPPPPPGSGGTNPPSTGPSAQCWWESAGTYNGHPHASNDPVSQPDMAYAGGICPTGSNDH